MFSRDPVDRDFRAASFLRTLAVGELAFNKPRNNIMKFFAPVHSTRVGPREITILQSDLGANFSASSLKHSS